MEEANGWKQSSWFGWYADDNYPMVMHVHHGWLYCHPAGDWVWMWDYNLNEWFVSTGEIYPMLYESSSGNWFWYYRDTANPRWYVELSTAEVFTEFEGVLMPKLMKDAFEGATTLAAGVGEAESEIIPMEVLGFALLPILGDPATSECPIITRTPEEVSLFALPPEITARADFGSGCAFGESLGIIGGLIDIDVSGLNFTSEAISLNLDLIATNLTRDGSPLLNGALSAGVSLATSESEEETGTEIITTSVTDLDGSLVFDNLVGLDQTLNGEMGLNGVYTTILREEKATGDESESAHGDISLVFDNFVSDALSILSGQVRAEFEMPGTSLLEMNAQTPEGPMVMTLSIEQDASGDRVEMNTVGPADMMGYTLTIDGLVWDAVQCESNPISGSIHLGFGGSRYVVRFSGACDGSFTVSRD